jgi:hypothetical protein
MGSGRADALTVAVSSGSGGDRRGRWAYVDGRYAQPDQTGYLTPGRVRSEVLAGPSRTAGQGQYQGGTMVEAVYIPLALAIVLPFPTGAWMAERSG